MKVEREKSPSVPISTDSDLKKKGKPGTKPSQRATPQPNTIGTNKRKAVTPPNRDEAKKVGNPDSRHFVSLLPVFLA